ncbi:MAG TPA: hypothetical protein PKN48_15540 [Bacteroidales bacterium]|nr:hypothetical protein [Bacteroidales bacterium]
MRQNNKVIETKDHIKQLISYFGKKKVFTTKNLEAYYISREGSIKRNTLNWRVHYLIEKGILTRTGRGQFIVGNDKAFEPELSPIIKKLDKHLKKSFPFLKFCLWDTEQIRGLSQHLPSLKLTIVDVERDGTESVFHHLQEKYKNVYLMPDLEVMNTYVIRSKNPIIVKVLVSEAPVYELGGITTASIEKILVDVFFEEEFVSLHGSEMLHIFTNAFERYPINTGKMLRYADRKRKKAELKKFLISNKLAAK